MSSGAGLPGQRIVLEHLENRKRAYQKLLSMGRPRPLSELVFLEDQQRICEITDSVPLRQLAGSLGAQLEILPEVTILLKNTFNMLIACSHLLTTTLAHCQPAMNMKSSAVYGETVSLVLLISDAY